MKLFASILFIPILGSLLYFTSCGDRFNLVPDPSEVVDVPGYSEESTIAPTGINDVNQIIGYHGGAYPVTIRDTYDLSDAIGFVIKSDETGFLELNRADHRNNWPYAINNDGEVVGAYLPEGNYTSEYLPAFAYRMNSDGTGFEDLHPEGAFYSIATDITSQGMVLGHFGMRPLYSTACIFSGDSVISLVDPSEVSFSKISCANDQFAIIYGQVNNSYYTYYSYEYETERLKQLNIDTNTADFSDLHGINDHNVAVGFYVDLQVNGLAIGLVYDLETDELQTYNPTNESGGSTFHEYEFYDITNSGNIIGRAGREHGGGLLQLRAMAINGDFTNFRDITPENDGIYSEMIAMNNNGVALGAIGLPRRNLAVANKLFVVQVP